MAGLHTFFHGPISQAAADERLSRAVPVRDGRFLVREEDGGAGLFDLAVVAGSAILHLPVATAASPAAGFAVNAIAFPACGSLEELVMALQDPACLAEGFPIVLTSPVQRPTPPSSPDVRRSSWLTAKAKEEALKARALYKTKSKEAVVARERALRESELGHTETAQQQLKTAHEAEAHARIGRDKSVAAEERALSVSGSPERALSPSSAAGGGRLTRPSQLSTEDSVPVQDPDLARMVATTPFLHPNGSRASADERLSTQPSGAFLVYACDGAEAGTLAVVQTPGVVKHYPLSREPGTKTICVAGNRLGGRCGTLQQLADALMGPAAKEHGWPDAALVKPVLRKASTPTLTPEARRQSWLEQRGKEAAGKLRQAKSRALDASS